MCKVLIKVIKISETKISKKKLFKCESSYEIVGVMKS